MRVTARSHHLLPPFRTESLEERRSGEKEEQMAATRTRRALGARAVAESNCADPDVAGDFGDRESACSNRAGRTRIQLMSTMALCFPVLHAVLSSVSVRLVVAVKHSHIAELESTFWAVSDPESARYGAFLSHTEVTELFAPAPASLAALERWVQCDRTLAIEYLTPGAEWAEITGATARTAGMLLNCTIVAGPDRAPHCADGVYTLPTELRSHVDYISGMGGARGTVRRSRRRRGGTGGDASAVPGDATTLAALRSRYGVTTVASSSATQATAQFAVHRSNNYSPSDLAAFHAKFGVGSPGSPVPTVVTVGDNDPAHPGEEGTLDIQILSGIAGGAATTSFWNTDGGSESFADWAIGVLASADPPLVHSVSYDDYEEQDSEEFMRRGDIEFMKAGVRGLTILFASGDYGTGCNMSTLPAKFAPEWPPTSPYVTAVGGTALQGDTEVAWPMGGGGFAFAHTQPGYQAAAVAEYLRTAHALPDAALFNSSNRGFPDVSALATNYAIVLNGQVSTVSGTSASTPTWAAIVTLLNDARREKGIAPLGFLNPFLYANAKRGFHDVTVGANDAYTCFTGDGFSAAVGWDPATGLGSPNFPALLAAATNASTQR